MLAGSLVVPLAVQPSWSYLAFSFTDVAGKAWLKQETTHFETNVAATNNDNNSHA